MKKQVTIVAGNVSDEARQWLEQHGAKIEGFGLLIITLPEQAQVQKGSYGWDYAIAFYNAEGNDEESWIDIELDIDAYETRLRLKYGGDRQCTCKGKGCAECVEELAAIERGENPYVHHTSPRDWQLGDRVIRPGAQVAGKVITTEPEHVTVKLDGLGERRYRKDELVRL
jgi:hypothetical protein